MTVNHTVLDNAVWHALSGPHARFAKGSDRARRYDAEISIFWASADASDESWDALAELARPSSVVVVFRGLSTDPPPAWTTLLRGEAHQMVLQHSPADVPVLPARDEDTGEAVSMRPLTADDVTAMLELVELTQPGPFQRRTAELGGYLGIFHGRTLVAMAGQRFRLPDHCEVSAVCTHPSARRRGYGSIVSAAVARSIADGGETPFLHVTVENEPARLAYEALGFVTRRTVTFAAVRPPAH